MWRIVAMGAVPAALLGAGSGLLFSRDFIDYRPMGEIYMAQDSMSYTGGPPSYIGPFLGGPGPFYVAPSQREASLNPAEFIEDEYPVDSAAIASGPFALSVADRAFDVAAIAPVDPPANAVAARQAPEAVEGPAQAEHDAKPTEAPPAANLDAAP